MITSSWCTPPGVPSTLAAVRGETYFTSPCKISAGIPSGLGTTVPHTPLWEQRAELPSVVFYSKEGVGKVQGIVFRGEKEKAAVIQDEISWFIFLV